jgi:hypothetical protein
MASNQYYFALEDLQSLIDRYGARGPEHELDGKPCLGVVFTPGGEPKDAGKVYSFPLYGDAGRAGVSDDIIVQNTTMDIGCPYPPRCK